MLKARLLVVQHMVSEAPAVKGCALSPAWLAAKQGIRSRTVRCRVVPVPFYPGYFRLEQGDTFTKLVLRIRAKVLGGELAGRIAFGAGTIFVFHRDCILGPDRPCCQ